MTVFLPNIIESVWNVKAKIFITKKQLKTKCFIHVNSPQTFIFAWSKQRKKGTRAEIPACKQNWILISVLGFEYFFAPFCRCLWCFRQVKYLLCLFEILKKLFLWWIHVDTSMISLYCWVNKREKSFSCMRVLFWQFHSWIVEEEKWKAFWCGCESFDCFEFIKPTSLLGAHVHWIFILLSFYIHEKLRI